MMPDAIATAKGGAPDIATVGESVTVRRTAVGEAVPSATVRFLGDWRETAEGALRRGAPLTIHYDPSRLPYCRQNWRGAEIWNIEAFVRVHPRGEILRGGVLKAVREPPEMGMVVALVPAPFVFSVPADTTQVELWFHNFYQTSSRCDAWDSRFGQNYWFDVGGAPPRIPAQCVSYRVGAVTRPDMVNVLGQMVTKVNVFPRPPGGGSPEGSNLQTFLSV